VAVLVEAEVAPAAAVAAAVLVEAEVAAQAVPVVVEAPAKLSTPLHRGLDLVALQLNSPGFLVRSTTANECTIAYPRSFGG
jgi:hypothetical protein